MGGEERIAAEGGAGGGARVVDEFVEALAVTRENQAVAAGGAAAPAITPAANRRAKTRTAVGAEARRPGAESTPGRAAPSV